MTDSTFVAEPGPTLAYELAARRAGATTIAGVDEAGRGPLAGPVVVAAVILDPGTIPPGLDDSKKLTAAKRAALFDLIMASAIVSVVSAPPLVIAQRNIRGATLWAMREAVLALCRRPDHVLVDGRDVPPGLPMRTEPVIKGDALSVSIAAASIVAKVTRDRMCAVMDCDAPQFGFLAHKGYSTAVHLSAIAAHGPCAHHRADFAPVAEALLARGLTFGSP